MVKYDYIYDMGILSAVRLFLSQITSESPSQALGDPQDVYSQPPEDTSSNDIQDIPPPVISPPMAVYEIEPSPELLIENYLEAQIRILGQPLIDKLDRIDYNLSAEKLTEEENARIKKFEKCPERQALLDKAWELFTEAYPLDEDGNLIINPEAKERLEAFLQKCGAYSIDDNTIRLFFRLTNKDLDPKDLELILQYLSANKEYKAILEQKLIQRVVSLILEDSISYDGRRNTIDSKINKSIEAYWLVLELVLDGGRNIGQLIAQSVLTEINEGYLTDFGDNFLKFLTADEGLKQNILTKLILISQEYYMAPWGSPERISLYQQTQTIYYIALAAGIPDEEISAQQLISALPPSPLTNYPKLSKDFHQWAYMLFRIKSTPEKVDQQKVKPYYLNKIKDLIKTYLEATSWEERSVLEAMISHYLSFAQDIGVNLDEVKAMIESLRPKRRQRPITLEEIKQKGYLSIQAEDLPVEIIEIIKKTGMWEKICSSVTRINLIHDINASSFETNTGGIGGKVSVPGVISIDTRDEISGSMLSAYEIALILIHEGAHIEWDLAHYDNLYLLRSLPEERNAYLKQYWAASKLLYELMRQKQPDQNDLIYLASFVLQSYYAVRDANSVLGYPSDDFSVRSDIISLEQTDLDIYPTLISEQDFTPDLSILTLPLLERLDYMLVQISQGGDFRHFEGMILPQEKEEAKEYLDYVFSINLKGCSEAAFQFLIQYSL